MTGKLAETITTLVARPDIGPWLILGATTLVSLAMTYMLFALSHILRLGGDVRIADADHAAHLAEATIPGFDASEIALDRARIGALVRNRAGRVLLIRRHGARFVGRELTTHEGIRLDRTCLTLETGDPRFGPLTLDLGAAAQTWAASLRRLGTETAA
jgi:hypothetical protein